MKNDNKQNKALSQTCVMQSVLKASDCRYGNYIEYGGSITQLNEREMCHFFRFPETYKPIPLTEKWLIGFNFNFKELGFPELSVSHHLFGNKFYFHIQNYAKEIFFVHELQNLYFALTQRELTVA
jgi:hypothetical protein